ncbi:4Fe-4S dicluster domain-containing protein [Methanocorpusculum vombati]|uniref:4Fe-4S binding protein n=1 Tax=Methanocorpusculum vombati TaxID=3002864 RepID=A0ABT4INP2_9EURY|nr:4Fe-4S dicluster domain-containing protein [Methanocorpusculum vombati]MCZ9320034.1 4Fe-4S binding protein [Methanocorpusculum sp.]MCZ0863362.1 4Fe-4S binding protein [Methanocorpusculum vombati]MDE2520173.1 4Fe-4S binding protein [Methanocorpusculum sp.]MDE2534858.1 4Fe-4S binding protein [Methanocorpusculum sp.]MDE2545957.1 4Fe-4S binding protein [Methanocorpusculum sp.]
MAGLPMFKEILMQSVKKPVTNLFPALRLPKSITGFLGSVAEGKAAITPPVATPPAFRGKIVYDRTACNGCGLCLKVCPAHAIEQVVYPPVTVSVTDAEGNVSAKVKKEKRVRIYVANCIFCGQCTDICSRNALSMSSEFLLATEDRFAESQIVE